MKEVKEKFNDLGYILFGVNNSKFAKRDITQYYDWSPIYKIKLLEERLENLEKKV